MRTPNSLPLGAPTDTSGRPPSPRRREAMAALSLAALLVAGGSLGFVAFAGFTLDVVVGALMAFVLIASVVVLRVDGFHPYPRFGVANRVTSIRAAVNCVIAGLLLDPMRLQADWTAGIGWVVLGLALASLLLDGVDGYLARHKGEVSRFGARFDVEIDATLLLVLSALVFVLGKAGPWVLLIGGVYYGFAAARGIWPWLRCELPPGRWRKAVFVLQASSLLVAVAPNVAAATATLVLAFALTVLVASFAVDLRWLVRHAPR
ncbi:MAG: CDP-alcohol phosphatidyltransferase family protein [Geminicoccaceae bacterium]|nr:MAG: CDP-alcohol phosphatidyltransferase family protein [Geminicoccaceae bacterium]